MPRVAGAVLAIVAGVAGTLALRATTLSTHQPVSPDSRTELLLRASVHHGEGGHRALDMVDALLLHCRLEVSSKPVGPVEELDGGRFRAVFQPSMDRTNRRQFRGCVEDWTVEHLQVDVLSLAEAA